MISSIMIKASERRGVEKKMLALHEQRLQMEHIKAEKETQRFDQMQNVSNRRLDLDEKRFEVNKQERKLRRNSAS